MKKFILTISEVRTKLKRVLNNPKLGFKNINENARTKIIPRNMDVPYSRAAMRDRFPQHWFWEKNTK